MFRLLLNIFIIILLSLVLFACEEFESKKLSTTSTPISNSDIPLLNPPNFLNTPTANGDPLYFQQWYLNNTGQDAYSSNGGMSGVDLNLNGLTETGRNVLINVIDDGVQLYHEDLIDNSADGSVHNLGILRHGTAVAGIILAKANNGLGGRGVAPNAKFISYDFLNQQGLVNLISALMATADIVNQSYGATITTDTLPSFFINNAYQAGVERSRSSGGVGTIYIKAAGNSFESRNYSSCDDSLVQSPITCGNVNTEPENTIYYNIIVAAVNASGVKASYSTAGSNILISGLGGEFGRNFPAIITTDGSGCDYGYSSARTGGRRIIPQNLDMHCNYTSIFNGTSAAAPTVVGVVALLLEANPNLGWRDVRNILVQTAKQIDITRDAIKTVKNSTSIVADATAELGWTRNAVGLNFHNWYGFGLVDASAAVRMAKNSYTNLSALSTINNSRGNLSISIPDKDFTGATNNINISESLTIESVEIRVNITHPYVNDLGIFLISPSGTESLLLNFNNWFGGDDNLYMILSTQAFYGENSMGNWRIKVVDYRSSNTGNLNSWEIKIYGH